MPSSWNAAFCALAGSCAALASVFGKLGGDKEIAASVFSKWLIGRLSDDQAAMALVVLRLLCYGGVVVCNVAMWSLYVRSLRVLSSLQATVLNTAANLFCSGMFGLIFFQESLRPQWILGVLCISCGLLLLTKGASDSGTQEWELQKED